MTTNDINFACLQCEQPLVVDASAQGRRLQCPNCDCELTVPVLPGFSAEADGEAAPVVASRKALIGGGAGRRMQDLQSQVDRLAAELANVFEQSKSQGSELSERDRLLAEREQAMEQLWAAVRQQQLEKETLTAEVERLRGEALNGLAEQTGAAQRLQEALAKVEALQQEAAAKEHTLQHVLTEQTELQTKLDEAELNGRSLTRQLSERDADLERRGKRITELEAQLKQAAAVAAQLKEVEQARDALEKTRQRLEGENAQLREGLQESTAGREMIRLRERTQEAENLAQRAQRAQREAENEKAKAQAEEARWRDAADKLRLRVETLEKNRGEATGSGLEQEMNVLRGLVERQQADLQKTYRELARYKRKQVGGNLLTIVVLLVLIGLMAAALWWARQQPWSPF